MKEKATPAPPTNTPAETPTDSSASPTAPRLTPGVATLLRGTNARSQTEPAKEEQPQPNGESQAASKKPAPRSRAVTISLIVADVLLLALAARMVLKAQGHLGFIEIALCVVALGLGAWLSCLALWRDRDSP